MSYRTIPKVSVIMPVYNAEKYLQEAIDSILAQTFTDFEFIIINDGSTDSSKDIILGYSDPRIIYFENETNLGICITLNRGLDIARGKYIARMDSDDIALLNRLEVQLKYMDEHPEIGASGSDVEIFGDGINSYIFTQVHVPEECSAGLLFNSCFAHPSVVLRKEILNTYTLRYKDEYRGLEDYELWWQLNKHVKLSNIAQPLLKYRKHIAQETNNVSRRVYEAFVKFAKIRFDDLKIPLSTKELALWNAYSFGHFDRFDDRAIDMYMSLSRTIIKKYPNKTSKDLIALKLTLAKSISFILKNSKNYKKRRQIYYNRALCNGIFPFSWFLKVSIRNILYEDKCNNSSL